VDIETAARILGCGRTLAYDLVKRGEFPCRVLRLGKRYLVPTAALLETLGLRPQEAPHARDEDGRAAV
jgi:excisionase family DNA binding protein